MSREIGSNATKGHAAFAIVASFFVAVILTGCVGGRGYHDIPAQGPPLAPPYLAMDHETQVATLHFPSGEYSLRAEDDAGFYYAAPRPVFEHTALGPRPREGGIYVNKRDPRKLRGYVYWGGVRTHVGDLSRVGHEFSQGADQPGSPISWRDEQE